MIRFTPDGKREIMIVSVVCGLLACGAVLLWPPLAIIPFIIWAALLLFFRDPHRNVPAVPDALLAPADGTIWDITELENDPDIGGPAWKIGIFLSVFNVHINRWPCSGTVIKTTHNPGAFHDARSDEAKDSNESQTTLLDSDSPIKGPVVVRQITGAIARRIVAHVKPGDKAAAGARFGMIKFGSRTELIWPKTDGWELSVKVGDKVKAGETVMARTPFFEGAPGAAGPGELSAAESGHVES